VKRDLAWLVGIIFTILLVAQIISIWYVGNLGLSLKETAYQGDDRVVIIDRSELREFERGYSSTKEEGWCLYGSINQTAIRITDVVHAEALSKQSAEIAFTCVPETATQLVAGRNPVLIGAVHSHPSRDRSRLSRTDTMTWGRTTPVIKVMGVYTEVDGVAFFTVKSLLDPLDTRTVRATPSSENHNRHSSGSDSS